MVGYCPHSVTVGERLQLKYIIPLEFPLLSELGRGSNPGLGTEEFRFAFKFRALNPQPLLPWLPNVACGMPQAQFTHQALHEVESKLLTGVNFLGSITGVIKGDAGSFDPKPESLSPNPCLRLKTYRAY